MNYCISFPLAVKKKKDNGPELLCVLQGHLDIVKLIMKFRVWFASVLLILN